LSTEGVDDRGLERSLARVLRAGTWLGSIAIAAGWALRCMGWGHVMSAMTCMRMVTLGIALFILLPVLRVVLMTVAFIRKRDLAFSAIAIAVLLVIALAAFTEMGGH
jgi:hypothetical protein